MSSKKRQAEGWQRGLLSVQPGAFFVLAALLLALSVMAALTVRAGAAFGPLLKLRGEVVHVSEVRDAGTYVELIVAGVPVRLRRAFPAASPRLLAAARAGIAKGALAVVEVEGEEYGERTHQQDPDAFVSFISLSVDGQELATRDELERAMGSNVRAALYACGICATLALLCLWLGLLRRKLVAPPPDVVLGKMRSENLLALKPPFPLHAHYARRHYIVLLLSLLFTAPVAAGLLVHAVSEAQTAQREDAIWRDGTRGTARIVSSAVRHEQYSHTQALTLQIEEPVSARREVHVILEYGAAMLREPLEVRWLPARPDEVMIEAKHRQIRNRLVMAGGFASIGLVMAALGLFLSARARSQLDALRSMARDGKVVSVELVSMVATSGQAPGSTVTFRTADGREKREHLPAGALPWRVDPRHMLALTTQDQHDFALLREDGFPLALR